MQCTFCKREEADVQLACPTCKKPFLACNTCWWGWQGRVTHCGQKLAMAGYYSLDKASHSLGELYGEAVRRAKQFYPKMSLDYFEAFLVSPMGVYSTADEDDLETTLSMYSIAGTTKQIRSLTLTKYVDFLLQHNLLSGSCGATSELLDGVMSLKGAAPEMEDTNVQALLGLLAGTKARHWTCRISRKPHSFFIECVDGMACIYQSYFSKYTLAQSMRSAQPRPVKELLADLEECMGDEQKLRKLKLQLFMAEVHWGSPKVQYHLNEAPANPRIVLYNFRKLLEHHASAWRNAMGRKVSELCPSKSKAQPMVRNAPANVTCKADELPYFMTLTEEQEELARKMGLKEGTVVDSMLFEGQRYRITQADTGGKQYTLQLV